MFGALAQAVPDRVAADGSRRLDAAELRRLSGWQALSSSPRPSWAPGARRGDHDGQEGVPHMGANQSNVPIEMIEANYPLRIRRYGLVADTGGAGQVPRRQCAYPRVRVPRPTARLLAAHGQARLPAARPLRREGGQPAGQHPDHCRRQARASRACHRADHAQEGRYFLSHHSFRGRIRSGPRARSGAACLPMSVMKRCRRTARATSMAS